MNLQVKVDQITSNQFIIWTSEGAFLQSYQTVIAFRDTAGNVTLDEKKWDYSVTTARHRNQFLRETTKEIEAKVASGEYKLADLNA